MVTAMRSAGMLALIGGGYVLGADYSRWLAIALLFAGAALLGSSRGIEETPRP